MKIRTVHQRGFTAIEVLAATMLASLMLAAVAGVLGSLARQERALRAGDDAQYWQQQFADLLLWDLRNSRQFLVARDGARLVGFAARDFATGRPTGRPATIEYYLVEANRERWVVRRETHSDEHTNDSVRLEFACRGIKQIKFGQVLIDQVAGAQSGPNQLAHIDTTGIPDSIPVQLYASAASAPLFDKVLCVR